LFTSIFVFKVYYHFFLFLFFDFTSAGSDQQPPPKKAKVVEYLFDFPAESTSSQVHDATAGVTLVQLLAAWKAASPTVPLAALTRLLKLLKEYRPEVNYDELPSSAREIVKASGNHAKMQPTIKFKT
jgi:hypothetical protein